MNFKAKILFKAAFSLLTLFLLSFQLSSQGIVKGSGIRYYDGYTIATYRNATAPVTSVGTEFAYFIDLNIVCKWDRTNNIWVPVNNILVQSGVPTHTPGVGDPLLYLDKSTGDFYKWGGSLWTLYSGGVSSVTVSSLAMVSDTSLLTPATGDQFVLVSKDTFGVYASDRWLIVASDGSSSFSGLSDTPPNYTGQANKMVLVNSGENGLVFADTSGLGGTGASGDNQAILKNTINAIAENGFNRSDQPSMAQVSGDTLLLTYTAFPGNSADFGSSYIVGRFSYDNGFTFGDTVTIQSTPIGYSSVTQPALINLGGDTLLMLTRAVETIDPYDGDIFKSQSNDGGATWTTPTALTSDANYYVPTSDALIKTYTGRLIYPYALNTNEFAFSSLGNFEGRFLYSDDNGATWSVNNPALMPIGADNTSADSLFVEIGAYQLPFDSTIIAYGRTRLDWVYYSESSDDGDTWSSVKRYPIQTGNSQSKFEFIESLGIIVGARNALQYDGTAAPYEANNFSRAYLDVVISATSKEFKTGESFHQFMRIDNRDPDNNPLIAIEPAIEDVGDNIHIFYSKGSSDLTKYSLEQIIIPKNMLLGDYSAEVVGDVFSTGRIGVNLNSTRSLRPRNYLDIVLDKDIGSIPSVQDISGISISNNEDGGYLALGEANKNVSGSYNRIKSLSKESGVPGLELFAYVNPNATTRPALLVTVIDDDESGPADDDEILFSIENQGTERLSVLGDGHTDIIGELDASSFSDFRMDVGTSTGSPTPRFDLLNEGASGDFLPRIRVTPEGTNNNFQIITTTNPTDADEPAMEIILEDGAQSGAGEIPDGQSALLVNNSFTSTIFDLKGNGDLTISGNLTAAFNDIEVTDPASTKGLRIEDDESGGYFRIIEGTGGAGSFFPRIQTLPVGSSLYTQWQTRRSSGAATFTPNFRLQVQNTAGNGAIGDTELGFEVMNNVTSIFRMYGLGNAYFKDDLEIDGNSIDLGDFILTTGTGSPEGSIVGTPGDMFVDQTSGDWYRKNTGTSNTGWLVQVGAADDLGNHTATQTLNIGTEWISQNTDLDGINISGNDIIAKSFPTSTTQLELSTGNGVASIIANSASNPDVSLNFNNSATNPYLSTQFAGLLNHRRFADNVAGLSISTDPTFTSNDTYFRHWIVREGAVGTARMKIKDGTAEEKELAYLDDIPINRTGWAQYSSNTIDRTTPQIITNGPTDTLTLNLVPTDSITLEMPHGMESLFSSSDTTILANNSGDGYVLRLDIDVRSSTTDNYGVFLLDIGGSQGVIVERTISFPRGAGVWTRQSISFNYYTLGTFVANGGKIRLVAPDDNWDVANPALVITKIHAAQ